jgi:ubiquinone biosynthesis monooxygenase Coq7
VVHRHLEDQLIFLEGRDHDLKSLISSIQDEELSHLHVAQRRRGGECMVLRGAVALIGSLTDLLIWLSTWGDSTRMAREMRSAS